MHKQGTPVQGSTFKEDIQGVRGLILASKVWTLRLDLEGRECWVAGWGTGPSGAVLEYQSALGDRQPLRNTLITALLLDLYGEKRVRGAGLNTRSVRACARLSQSGRRGRLDPSRGLEGNKRRFLLEDHGLLMSGLLIGRVCLAEGPVGPRDQGSLGELARLVSKGEVRVL